MSETLSQDPDGLGVAYTTLAPSYPSTPATPSSTVQDAPPGANLPPFSTFSSDMDSNGTFSSVSDRLFSDTRLLDISNWDYYTETRLIERGENGLSIISSQPQYRPWESKPLDSTSAFATTTQANTFTDAFSPQNGAPKLPSFQSQFQAFSDPATTTEPTLTTLTNLTPVSPNSSSSPQSQTLTPLSSSFHTLSAVNPRGYPLVPAPIQAREVPSIQQQFLDERHIQLYSHPTANLTLNNTIHSASIFPAQNGAIIQNSQIISSPTVVTLLKTEPDIKLTTSLTQLHQANPGLKLQNVALHPTQFQNPMSVLDSDAGLYNGIDKKINGSSSIMTSPSRNDFRKKERRKIRANSLESSAESDGNSNMDLNSENSGQVAAVSSTDGFKNHHSMAVNMEHEISGGSMDKQVKKKRKRCGECVGCQKKDNCGDCAPCRNDKSHQICKLRRCEKLTEKKSLYGEPYMRGESRRGRGKGRGGASYRGRKPNGPIASLTAGGIPAPSETNGGLSAQQPPTRPSPQPPSGIAQPMPVQQQPMTPMPFYADPNRFPTPVWQADPSQVSGWQGQFIQQIPTAGQPIDTYQQYPNGIYQTTYQQPAFESNTFYTGAVQVLTPTNTRPPSAPNQQAQMIPQRPNSNYAHTPSPGPAGQQAQQQAQQQQTQQQQTQQQQNSNRQYQEYTQFGSNASNEGSQSRPSSVNSVINQNPATPNANYNQGGQQQNQSQQSQQQQTVYTTVSAANFSPSSNQQQTQFVNANSGNGQPGYPQVNASSPQVVSHNSSGYSGNEQFSGQQNQQQWQQQDHQQIMWAQQQQQQQVQENKMEQQSYQQQVEQQNNPGQYMNQQQKDLSESSSPTKMQSDNIQRTFSQADKVNLNTRIKTMILNKQQNDVKMEQDVKNVEQNTTGHFLWYSHHHHLNPLSVDGGPSKNNLPNRDDNSLVNISPNNTQMFAQNNFKQPKTMKENHNQLPLRMQRPLHHNHINNNTYLRKKEYLLYDGRSKPTIQSNIAGKQITNQHNLIPKTEPLDDLTHGTLEPKQLFLDQKENNITETEVQPTVLTNFQARDKVSKTSPNSQIHPIIIKEEATDQQANINLNERHTFSNRLESNITHISGHVLNRLGLLPDINQEINGKFQQSAINQESHNVKHHPINTSEKMNDNQRHTKHSPRSDLLTCSSPEGCLPGKNFQIVNGSEKVFITPPTTPNIPRGTQQQNKLQSPSVSSVNSPRPASCDQTPFSKSSEICSANSISPGMQGIVNETSSSGISNVDSMPPKSLFHTSPLFTNTTKHYLSRSETQNSVPLTANNTASQSPMPSCIRKSPFVKNFNIPESESSLSSQPVSSKSYVIDANANSHCSNGMPSSHRDLLLNKTEKKISPFSRFTSSVDSYDSNSPQKKFGQTENQYSAQDFSMSNVNKEENKPSPEKNLRDQFCSPTSSDQVKSRLSNKSDKSPPKIIGEQIPQCHCFPSDQSPPEPGTYYTHLGCANNLRTLRHNLECQTGLSGQAIRIEKVRYTGKEGKTAQGCPIVKWVHRRVNLEEKYLVIVKHRNGHFCQSAFIVICLVVWEGVTQNTSNDLYSLLTQQLNKFGIPTKRRCATNDPRTCACQGINEDTCGASFTFGCSWSMYYNGCKFTRSKDVRKFRLSVKEEETQIEEKLQNLADHVSPIYKALAPQSFLNQTKFEHVASECRLGTKPGRPFSGVTACMDFCAHAHKDIHNMNDGCTVVVTLTKHRGPSKSNEEQLHVLPLYVPDDTDEFGSKENQTLKVDNGEIEILNKYECEVRTFSEPAERCRNRKGKKEEGQRKRKSATPQPSSPSVSSTSFQQSPQDSPLPYNNSEIQSGQVSSTVVDSPNRNPSWRYDNFNSNSENSIGVHSNGNNSISHLPQFSVFKTPYSYDHGAFSNHYSQDGRLSNYPLSRNYYSTTNEFHHPTPNLFSHYLTKHTSAYTVSNPFDDLYLNNTPPPPAGLKTTDEIKPKSVEISYTDNSECFTDPAVGGVAIALTHGSILFECAKHELHATTALKIPDRTNPTRISLVFYQHRSLNKSQHGLDEYTLKQKSKLDSLQSDTVEFESSFENSSLNISLEKRSGEVTMRTATLPTYSMTTMFPMYPCMVTGPYQEHYGGTLSMPNK